MWAAWSVAAVVGIVHFAVAGQYGDISQRALLHRLRTTPGIRLRRPAPAGAIARSGDAVGRHASLAAAASCCPRCNFLGAANRGVCSVAWRGHARCVDCGYCRGERDVGNGDDGNAFDLDLRAACLHRNRLFCDARVPARRASRVLVGGCDCGPGVRGQVWRAVLGTWPRHRHCADRTARGVSLARLVDRRTDCRRS